MSDRPDIDPSDLYGEPTPTREEMREESELIAADEARDVLEQQGAFDSPEDAGSIPAPHAVSSAAEHGPGGGPAGDAPPAEIGPDRCRTSGNPTSGDLPEVVLPRPPWMPEGERPQGVPVDHCIAQAVEFLWDNGVITLSSCCGHGSRPPSLVLGSGESADLARRLLSEVDARRYELHQWQLVKV